MNANVTMLNVGDGDAIIVHLSKEKKNLVMVIDGGTAGNYEAKLKPALQKLLKDLKKDGPDVVVCTHFDSDHIGGLIPLVTDYITHIEQVWVHKIPSMFANHKQILNEVFNSDKIGRLENAEANYFKKLLEAKYARLDTELAFNNSALVLESINQLKQLIDLIPEGKLKEVFHNQKPIEDWQEVQVLGPTIEYFNSLFPANKDLKEFLIEESFQMIDERITPMREALIYENQFPCETLKDETTAKITATNKASIIIGIDTPKNERLLFTGDAGIESFKNIPNYKVELKDLHWLKIPHHGSENNMSKEISALMNPVYAYNSGDRYQDDKVLNCFKSRERCIDVKTTKEGSDLNFSI